MQNRVGENIRKYRKMNGISQKHLASKVEVSVQGLLKIEKGIVSPRMVTVEKIVGVLGITPDQLFGLEEINQENSDIIGLLKKHKEG